MSSKISEDIILIIEYGGQYTHLISRRIRDFGVLTKLISYKALKESDLVNAKGIILSGGPRSVIDDESPYLPVEIEEILRANTIPVLGICYGHQLLGKFFSGKVIQSQSREYGKTVIQIKNKDSLFTHYSGDTFVSWMNHGDYIEEMTDDFDIIASSESCPVAAMKKKNGQIYGVQFHPEVTHTDGGFQILEKFVKEICNIKSSSWSMENYKNQLIKEMKEEVGDNLVIMGVSGGVDSLVASLVLKEAINDKLVLVFVDHGLLRKNEVETVVSLYQNTLKFSNFYHVDASNKFLEKLKNVRDPEKKRQIIGYTFIETFQEKAKDLENKFGKFSFLGQGTIYTDRVESGAVGFGTAKIKSHHNLTLPEKMNLKLTEPIKELYKDEVRELGKTFDVESALLNRYPFPGPGLAVRILGEITKEKIKILQDADAIFMEELEQSKHYSEVWQAFTVLLEGKAVGVQGDDRAYGHIVSLRAVISKDGMTADFAKLDWNFLGKVSTRIINEVKSITRVVYDISTKPPATIEFE